MTVTAPPLAPPRLVVRTSRIDDLPDDLGALVDLLPDTRPLAWVRHGDGVVGWGEALRFETFGPGRFADAEHAWHQVLVGASVHDDVDRPGTGPIAFGSFAFDDVVPGDETVDPTRASGVLIVPRVVVGRRDGVCWTTTIELLGDRAAPAPDALPEAYPRIPVTAPGQVHYADGSVSPEDWKGVVAEGISRIKERELDKVVLARDVAAAAQDPVDPRHLLGRLAQGYEACWTFSVDGLVGATPELLVRSEKGLVTSRVLAGTIPRTEGPDRLGAGDAGADRRAAALLAGSSKDLEEHAYAARSVAAALEPYCSSMNVPEVPFVLHLPNVMHLATDVTAVLDQSAGTRLGARDAVRGPGAGAAEVGAAGEPDGPRPPSSLSLAAALHPSAAVCGTPTESARSLIREIEGLDRARYAGPVGWVGADGDGEWGIALRSAEISERNPRHVRLFAGCGIVAASDPVAELAESEAKLEPMRYALRDD
ncbi:isochorismate synthase [Myceligenerans indicum]|uniref:Isochorismate synthase n=1 Tax=Myceligenerans indicum TaxID=2593663 RepID=A0ABS1LH03_9MICO|nr:chorismate-binding protein [Myceligenerans indicum]MBL0885487.1 isochorismate synthase [Myceligenerans indicum]